jgi:hypothetical protein
LYFPFPNNQQLVAMVCDPVMLTLALPWLCAAEYKDDVDNAKKLFKSALIDEATCSFWPPEPNTMLNMSPNDNDNIDVHVCDNDDMFGMVNIYSPDQDIKIGTNTTLDMATLNDLANEAFKGWNSLKVD